MKPTATRARSCEGKQAHDKQGAARHIASLRAATGAVGFSAYRCQFCSPKGGPYVWRVGRRSGRSGKRRQ